MVSDTDFWLFPYRLLEESFLRWGHALVSLHVKGGRLCHLTGSVV